MMQIMEASPLSRSTWLFAVAVVVAVTLASFVGAASKGAQKKALKLLNMLKQVDGAGSGLDADTVQGMTPAALQGARLVVKDSQGKVVGAVLGQGDDEVRQVVRNVGGQPVAFWVTTDGFTNDPSGVSFELFYASTDCTGPPEMVAGGGSHVLLPVAGVQGGVAYYASGAVLTGQSGSGESFDDVDICDPASLTSRGGCCSDASVADATAPAATVTLTSLGLVPPFHVEGP
jgi:hypothetical protein